MRETWATVSATTAALTELAIARLTGTRAGRRRAVALGLGTGIAVAVCTLFALAPVGAACGIHTPVTRCAAAPRRAASPAGAWALRGDLTGFVIRGRVSTYGSPLEQDAMTADGGSSRRPCIALLDRRTLGRRFLVTVGRHQAVLEHCDSGPYADGRVMDVTGHGALALGLDPRTFPTDAYATARLLRARPSGV